MRRVTVWITVVLVAVVLGLGYWLNTTGQTAKSGGTNEQTGKSGEVK